MNKKLINIIGGERTGSTLLDAMLGNGDNCFSCGEASFLFRPTRTEHFELACVCGNKNCSIWSNLKGAKQKDYYQYLFENYDVVIDSSKRLNWVIDSYKNSPNGIDIINILTWKGYEDILYSFWKRDYNLESKLSKYITYYKRIDQANIPFISIEHSTLAKEPAEITQAICSLIGIKYFSGKEKFWENPNAHFLYGSQGIRKQVQKGESKIYRKEEKPSVFYGELENATCLIDKNDFETIFSKISNYSLDDATIEIFKNCNIKKPVWYYYLKVGRKIKKYFPEHYEAKDVNPLFIKSE